MYRNIKSNFLQRYADVENCIKIPNNCKKNIKEVNDKKMNLRKKDSIHSHKNMRKQNKDWKDFNQS
jgi:L-ribulose-5-phosphate 3-epimerase UlaE|tara:strand:+ start:168 stop:365 length:198 start_codon:yes stop_codon:yes gene_type:complete